MSSRKRSPWRCWGGTYIPKIEGATGIIILLTIYIAITMMTIMIAVVSRMISIKEIIMNLILSIIIFIRRRCSGRMSSSSNAIYGRTISEGLCQFRDLGSLLVSWCQRKQMIVLRGASSTQAQDG
jgi:hypothetical protein